MGVRARGLFVVRERTMAIIGSRALVLPHVMWSQPQRHRCMLFWKLMPTETLKAVYLFPISAFSGKAIRPDISYALLFLFGLAITFLAFRILYCLWAHGPPRIPLASFSQECVPPVISPLRPRIFPVPELIPIAFWLNLSMPFLRKCSRPALFLITIMGGVMVTWCVLGRCLR